MLYLPPERRIGARRRSGAGPGGGGRCWGALMMKFQTVSVYGIDFSGAQRAGNNIWLAKGGADSQKLIIEDCFRAGDLPQSGKGIQTCLAAIVNLVKSNQSAKRSVRLYRR